MTIVLQAENLAHAFGNKAVLADVNFSLPAGEPVALIGPNGAGKTTLFSLICGYLPLQHGRLRVLGETPGSAKLTGRVGALPQDALFDPSFNLITQLSFYARLQGIGKAPARQEAERVLTLVGLAEHAGLLPTALSHGMRKRLAIAQALLGQPELILLDEPTAGLDPINALQIRQLIADLSTKATVLISSHNIFELERLCHTVLYLDKGQLVQQSTDNPQGGLGYLTVTLDHSVSDDVLAVFQQLPGVSRVLQQQKHEFQLVYNQEQQADLDLQLLQCLAAHGWRYRQLSKGQTLEQQLFAVNSQSA